MSRWRAILAICLCASWLLTGLLGGPHALAQTPDPWTPGPALLSDLEAVAERNCWTAEQAATHYRVAEVMGAIGSRLATEEPDAYVGIDLGKGPDAVPRLYVKGAASTLVARLVAEAGFPVEVIDHQPYAFPELEERSIRVQRGLLSMGIEDSSVGTDIAGAGRIPVLIRMTDMTPTEKIIRLSLPKDLRDDVDITFVTGGAWEGDESPSPNPCPSPSMSPESADASLDPGSMSPPASVGPSVAPSRSFDPCAPVPVAPTAAWGPLALVHDPAVDAIDVGFGPGRLDIGERCVTLRGSKGGPVTLVWRDGQTEWDAANGRIRFRDLSGTWIELADGDRLLLGGYDPTDEGGVPPLAPWVVRPATDCPEAEWLVHTVKVK